VFSLIGYEQGKAILEQYDKKKLFLMFLKYHYQLHPLVEFEKGVVDRKVEKGSILDIFEMIANISELTIQILSIESFFFIVLSSGCQRHQMSILMVGKT
jgi:hypothetical protein